MADASISVGADGGWVISGELGFGTVPSLLSHKGIGMEAGSHIQVDLAGVTRADSAGLALLVEWLRESDHRGASIRFENVPDQLRSIARVSGLNDILFP